MKHCSTRYVILTIVGFIFVVIGIVFCSFWPHTFGVFDQVINGKLPLRSEWGSEFWNDARDTPKNVEFYFFNWTNPEELKEPGKKPNFVEVGPYSFIEKVQKVNITHHPDNSTVSFDELTFWYFNQQKSIGSLSDKITQLNVLAVSAAHQQRYSHLNHNTLSRLLKNTASQLYTEKTVDELLLNGYEDKLIESLNKAFKNNTPLPDHFRWYQMENGTLTDRHINMGTGQDNLSNFGMIKNWNYKDTTSYYETACNRVEGSAGEFWPPNHNYEHITKWMPDLCRPVSYEYTGEKTHQGISGYQYSIGEKTLEINQSYCNGECSPTGLINITTCRHGEPIFISLPHFYEADPILREQIVGMNPNEIHHNSYITLNPSTGIPLDAAERLQINVLLQPIPTITLFEGVPKIYFPLLWMNIKSEITEKSAGTLSDLLILPRAILYGCISFVIIGVLIILIVGIIQYSRRKSDIFWVSTADDIEIEWRSRRYGERIQMNEEYYYNERLI